MTDRCDGLSTPRRNDYSSTETSCEPSAEQAATADALAQQATEREVEARRNVYFSSATDEGGRSSRASSDPGALQTSSKYDQHDKNAQLIAYYTRIDRPLPEDAAGNALVAAVGTAAIAGTRAASSGVDVAGAAIAKAVVDAAAKSLANAVLRESRGLVYDASRRGVTLPPSFGEAPAVSAAPAPRIPEVLPPLPFRTQG
jgi:hypothetical protein